LLCCAVLCCAVLCCAVLRCAALHCAALRCAVIFSCEPCCFQVVGPVVAKADSDTSNDNSLMGFLSDGASMLVRSTLLQVSNLIHCCNLASPSLN